MITDSNFEDELAGAPQYEIAHTIDASARLPCLNINTVASSPRPGVLVPAGHRTHQEREAGGRAVPRLAQGRHQFQDGGGVLLPGI